MFSFDIKYKFLQSNVNLSHVYLYPIINKYKKTLNNRHKKLWNKINKWY